MCQRKLGSKHIARSSTMMITFQGLMGCTYIHSSHTGCSFLEAPGRPGWEDGKTGVSLNFVHQDTDRALMDIMQRNRIVKISERRVALIPPVPVRKALAYIDRANCRVSSLDGLGRAGYRTLVQLVSVFSEHGVSTSLRRIQKCARRNSSVDRRRARPQSHHHIEICETILVRG